MKLEKSKIYTTDVFVKNIYEIVQKKMGKVFNILDIRFRIKKIMEIKDIEFDVIAKTKWGAARVSILIFILMEISDQIME